MIALIVATLIGAPVHLDARTYPSRIFGGERRVLVYMPPADTTHTPPAGLLICLWGGDYVNQIGAPATLDALIRGTRVPPLAAIFLDDAEDRFQSFDTTQKTARSIAEELLPWARSSLHVTADAAHTVVVGYSAAGLAATYAAYAHPDVIGNVVAQSGAFWRGFEGREAAEPEWLAQHFGLTPTRGTRFSLEVGGAETRESGGSGISILTANRHLRDVLLKQGYAVTYREVPNAQHEYGHWKAAFGAALEGIVKNWR